MKTARFMIASSLFLFALGVFNPGIASARDEGYDRLAKELSTAAARLTQPKVAIIPFSYVDKRKSDAGVVISERLTTRLVKLGKCTVIERQLLENVLQELHLEGTGIVDVETTKRIGKVLGVEAVITGTLMDIEDEQVEVNARLIRAETAEVIGSASADVRKTWADVVPMASAAAVPAYDQQVPNLVGQQQAAPAPAASPAPAAPTLVSAKRQMPAYLDIFFAPQVTSNMDLTFSNTAANIREPHLGLDLNGSGAIDSGAGYSKIRFKNAAAETTTPPVGFRVTGFGKHWGGDIEVSYQSTRIKKGVTKVSLNGGTDRPFEVPYDDYLTVNIVTLGAGDLLYRFSDKMIQPYLGMGMGLTLNFVQSPYIVSYINGITLVPPLDEVALGFQFRVPVGLRFEINRNMHAFFEYRMMYNTIWFGRDIKDESDTVVLTQNLFLAGVGFRL